jgi:hypothetical protein
LPTEEDKRIERKSEELNIIQPDKKTVDTADTKAKELLINGEKNKMIRKMGSL